MFEVTRKSGLRAMVNVNHVAWINETRDGCVVTLKESEEGVLVKLFSVSNYDDVIRQIEEEKRIAVVEEINLTPLHDCS